MFKALIHLFGHSKKIAIYSNNLSGNKSLLKSFTRKHYFLMSNHNFRRSIPGGKAVTLNESQSPNNFKLFAIICLKCRNTFQWMSWLLKERYRQICTHFCPPSANDSIFSNSRQPKLLSFWNHLTYMTKSGISFCMNAF